MNATKTRPLHLPHDVIRADLPVGVFRDPSSGRVYEVREMPEAERRAMYDGTPGLDDREAVVTGLSAHDARQLCTDLRARYDEAAVAVARLLYEPPRRYAVRTSSVEDIMAANPEIARA